MNPRASQLWALYQAAVRASTQAQEEEQREAMRACFARLVELEKAEPIQVSSKLHEPAAIQTTQTETK